MPVRLILFDIDGTLLLTQGAGMRALNRALLEAFRLPAGIQTVHPDGKTDPQIVREVLTLHGRGGEWSRDACEEVFARYVDYLARELHASDRVVVLPGVRELLERLSDESGSLPGVATGNIEAGARLKLKRAGLDKFFAYGGFGSDCEDRTELVRVAIRRGTQHCAPRTPEGVFVVGDTPRDIIHGRAAGASTVAVASGNYPLEELRSFRPDLAVRSLEPIEPVIAFLTQEPSIDLRPRMRTREPSMPGCPGTAKG